MYKATISYPQAGGRKVRTTHFSKWKCIAWLKAWWAIRYGNKDFFEIKVSAE